MPLLQLSLVSLLSNPGFFLSFFLFSIRIPDLFVLGASVDTLALPSLISTSSSDPPLLNHGLILESIPRHPAVTNMTQNLSSIASPHFVPTSNPDKTGALLQEFPRISSSEQEVTLNPVSQTYNDVTVQGKTECASCTKNAQSRPENQINLRLELVKRQILKKLGLTQPPSTLDLPSPENDELPLPLVQDGFLFDSFAHGHANTNDGNKNVEEFYGKTEQVVFFPKEDNPYCIRHPTDSSLCFHFEIPANNYRNLITDGDLWVYKGMDEIDLWVEEVIALDDGYKFVRLEVVQENAGSVGEWVKFRMFNVLRKWIDNPSESSHTIRLGCANCESWDSLSGFPIPQTGDHRPFIAAQLKSQTKKKRSRRSLDCTPNLQECCRESFVVSFKDIGWNSWIIRPEKYDAYLCKGSCHTLSAMAHSSTRHATVMQKYLRTFGASNRSQDIVPCCSASRLSPLSLLYRDPNDLNHTIKFETLPNMIVESCGCL